jgi:hypothetical protein
MTLQIFPGRAVIPGWAQVVIPAVAVVLLGWLVMSKLDQLTAWWPWSDESKLERSEAARIDAEMAAIADQLTAEAATRQVERIETHTREVITLREAAATAVDESRSPPDAETPLDPDQAERLRAGHQRLCDLYAPACERPADGAAAPGGDPALSGLPAARQSDAG